MLGLSAVAALSVLALALSAPAARAQDLFVANSGNGTVSRITNAGVVSKFASGFASPTGLAFAANGDLIVSNYDSGPTGLGTISRVTPQGVVSTFVASGLQNPEGLAFAANGDLFVSSQQGGFINRVTSAGVVSTFATGLSFPNGLAFGPNGDLFV